MLTNDDAVDMLKQMLARLMAMRGNAELLDTRIAFTIGYAAGVICEGLAALREDRPLRYIDAEEHTLDIDPNQDARDA